MLKFKKFVQPDTLEEAWKLNQSRANVVLGGTGWLKMGDKQWNTAIDLGKLGLGEIEEMRCWLSSICCWSWATLSLAAVSSSLVCSTFASRSSSVSPQAMVGLAAPMPTAMVQASASARTPDRVVDESGKGYLRGRR